MKFITLISSIFICISLLAQVKSEKQALEQWLPGCVVTIGDVNEFGIDNCFTSCEIDNEIYARIEGLSYKSDCTLPLSALRYIKVLHYNLQGEICLGEMICNKAISEDLLKIFKTLFELEYPIEKMLLVDEFGANDELSMVANNTSCFNFRYIAGTNKLSKHSLGLAVDINPLYNPYVKNKNGKISVEPKESEPYADRSNDFPYKIDKNDPCYREFIRYGFVWGGNWTYSKDYQHFEKKF